MNYIFMNFECDNILECVTNHVIIFYHPTRREMAHSLSERDDDDDDGDDARDGDARPMEAQSAAPGPSRPPDDPREPHYAALMRYQRDLATTPPGGSGRDVGSPVARPVASPRETAADALSSSSGPAVRRARDAPEETNAMRRFRLASAVPAARKTPPAANAPRGRPMVAVKACRKTPGKAPVASPASSSDTESRGRSPAAAPAAPEKETPTRKRTAPDVFAPSGGAGPSSRSSPAKKKGRKAGGAKGAVGKQKVKGKQRGAAGGKKKLTDEDLANCYAAMHSFTDLGDVEKCEEMRKYFEVMAPKCSNPYVWWHEVVPCAARDSKRPIEVLTWALERGAPLDPKAALSVCERAPHPLRTTAEGVYTSAVEVLRFLHERNCTIDEETLYCAAEFGELDCVRFMIDAVPGCRVANWSEHKTPKKKENNLMAVAAKNGHLGVLQYLYDVGCDFAPEDAAECIWQTMNRSPSSPINWHAIVRWVQSTEEYRQVSDIVDFYRPLGEPDR